MDAITTTLFPDISRAIRHLRQSTAIVNFDRLEGCDRMLAIPLLAVAQTLALAPLTHPVIPIAPQEAALATVLYVKITAKLSGFSLQEVVLAVLGDRLLAAALEDDSV
jgi:hypothetical protein